MPDSSQISSTLIQSTTADRNSLDYLSFRQIAKQYPGCVTAETLYTWACHHKYGFHLIDTKIGSSSRVRRDRWEAFLDSRTVGVIE